MQNKDMQKKDMKTSNCYCYTDRCSNCIHFITTRNGAGYSTGCRLNRHKQPGFIEKLIQHIKGE